MNKVLYQSLISLRIPILKNANFLKPSRFYNLQNGLYPIGARLMSLQQDFEEAKNKLNTLSEDPGNEVKLRIYGLYKQATEGPVKTDRPGVLDFVGRAKWDAWNANANLKQDEAQKKYIETIQGLLKEQESESTAQGSSDQKFKYILVEVEGGLRKITLNRPKKMNALLFEMYGEIVDALTEAKNDPKTVITVFTGAGNYYCSGNDLSNFTNVQPDQMKAMADNAYTVLKRFVGSFIDFDKPLIAVVNGPAVGVSVTTLGLFDAVYASDKATFDTPFTALGQSPEGCSSYIFPRLMGNAKASEMLLFNKKITATEAHQLNLVTEVFPDNSLQSEIWPRLQQYAKLPAKSLNYSKNLLRDAEKDALHKVNENECQRLKERWLSDDCINAIMQFFNRKKK